MDLSKLPKLSKTPPTPPDDAPGAGQMNMQDPAPISSGAICPTCSAPLRAGVRFCDNCGQPAAAPRATGDSYGMGAEAWISIGLGILLLFMFPTLILFAASKTLHTHFAPFDDGKGGKNSSALMTQPDGSDKIIPYLQTTPDIRPNFRSDLVVSVFAFALIFEGIALLASKRLIVVSLAFLVTVAATLLNLWFLLYTYNEYGLAIVSALAVLFGVYMAIYEWGLLQRVRR